MTLVISWWDIKLFSLWLSLDMNLRLLVLLPWFMLKYHTSCDWVPIPKVHIHFQCSTIFVLHHIQQSHLGRFIEMTQNNWISDDVYILLIYWSIGISKISTFSYRINLSAMSLFSQFFFILTDLRKYTSLSIHSILCIQIYSHCNITSSFIS